MNFHNLVYTFTIVILLALFVSDVLFAQPKNSYRLGGTWYCNNGYKKVGNKCVKLNVPANAKAVGSHWYCNIGFKKVGDSCQEMTSAGVSGAPAPRTAGPRTQPAVRFDPSVLQAQAILKSLGFYHGAADGLAGPHTGAALRSFQARVRLSPTGELDAATTAVLLSLTRQRPIYRRYSSSTDCEGYNSETSAYVYGECDDGDFTGYDSETGNYVYGDCEPGGDLEAYDSETGTYIYGECD